MPHVRVGKFKLALPSSKIGRIVIGIILISGGLVGFLPVVGYWMIPAGVIVLSFDFHYVRRFRRRCEVFCVRCYRSWRKKK